MYNEYRQSADMMLNTETEFWEYYSRLLEIRTIISCGYGNFYIFLKPNYFKKIL